MIDRRRHLPPFTPSPDRASTNRDMRQRQVHEWAKRCFGPGTVSPDERVERFGEEAVELLQSEGVTRERLIEIIDKVYAKPPGDPSQEVGGVGVTLLGYCESRLLSADACEEAELTRILNKDPDHFKARHAAKLASGLARPHQELPADHPSRIPHSDRYGYGY